MKKLLCACFLALCVLFLSGCQLFSDALVLLPFLPVEEEPLAPIRSDEDLLAVSFLDVGQGDAILVSRKGAHILIDTGPQDAWDALQNALAARGVETLEYLILTHPHSDHIGCAPQILQTYPVKRVLMPDAPTNTRIFEKTLDAILEYSVPAQKARAGDSFELEEAKFSILSPLPGASFESLNNYSVVLRMTFGDTSFLFTGDAEREIEASLIRQGLYLKSDVLKVGHHGSSTSSTQAFLNEVRPQIAVICVGEGNSYGHPKAQILQRLEKLGASVYRTDQNGAVTVYSDGSTLSVSTEK